MSKKINVITLGCSKNLVDTEVMLHKLNSAGFEITPNEEEAEIIVINTCGFIDDAKKEAIDNILYAVSLKEEGIIKGVVVTGCLAERYQQEILNEMPEVDAVVGIGANGEIAEICKKVIEGNKVAEFPSKYCMPLEGDRILSTPSHYAYLKIAEGCSNHCTYCAIPKIRGRLTRCDFMQHHAKHINVILKII